MNIELRYLDNLKIKIITGDREYLDKISEDFTFLVPGRFFMPLYKRKHWDGKINFINRVGYIFPYGILFDYLKESKKYNKKLVIDPKIKELFNGKKIIPGYNLSLTPYDYQIKCIEKVLNYTCGIIKVYTGGGKTLIMSYIANELIKNNEGPVIIVVPTTNLVEQFYSDMKSYGIKHTIGRVYSKSKEWDKEIVIATWQTLCKNLDLINNYNAILVDECHLIAKELSKILIKSTSAKYRVGFTGTLPADIIDILRIKSYTGPILKNYNAHWLTTHGYIAKCNIEHIMLKYKTKIKPSKKVTIKGKTKTVKKKIADIKNELFVLPFRLKVIAKIVQKCDDNVLILVEKVENEGDIIEQYLNDHTDKEVVFLSGKDSVEVREKWRAKCMKRNNLIVIATYGIFQLGVNIRNLKYIVLASSFKSVIRVLQSIGRALRIYKNKKDGAIIFDICDDIKFVKKHAKERLRIYEQEKFSIQKTVIKEK